ncbi:MAG: phage tail sheath protein, partial [Fusobacteriaceae bacterium]
SFATNSDSCSVVELQNQTVAHKIFTLSAQELTVMIAGAIAGCPLNRSLDNVTIPNLVTVDETEPTLGKFALYNDDDKVRVRIAVNSKTTYDSVWKPDTRFIKIFEGMNIVKYDIQDTFKNYWVGLYLNTYENKMAFCNLVSKVYFAELAPNVLSPDFDNRLFIDEEANKRFIITDGLDPETMSEMAIKRFPTGSQVFLGGEVRFTNTMIDLILELTY